MKYRFFDDNGTKMVEIECDDTNKVVRPAIDQDYLDAEQHEPQSAPKSGPTLGDPPTEKRVKAKKYSPERRAVKHNYA